MDKRKKRALLARIEGQLAMIARDNDAPSSRWRHVKWALNALQALPRDANENARLLQLQTHLVLLAGQQKEKTARFLLVQRLTLARADCVIWQLYLRRNVAREPVAGVA